MRFRLAVASLSTMLLVGCTVGPNYRDGSDWSDGALAPVFVPMFLDPRLVPLKQCEPALGGLRRARVARFMSRDHS